MFVLTSEFVIQKRLAWERIDILGIIKINADINKGEEDMINIWKAAFNIIVIVTCLAVVAGGIGCVVTFFHKVWTHVNRGIYRTTFQIDNPGYYALKWDIDNNTFECKNVDDGKNIK